MQRRISVPGNVAGDIADLAIAARTLCQEGLQILADDPVQQGPTRAARPIDLDPRCPGTGTSNGAGHNSPRVPEGSESWRSVDGEDQQSVTAAVVGAANHAQTQETRHGK